MLLENFQPAMDQDGKMVSPITYSVTTSPSGAVALPAGGTDIEFTNASASGIALIIFCPMGDAGAATPTTTNALPILAGQTKIYRCPERCNAIRHVGTASVTLVAAAGRGT